MSDAPLKKTALHSLEVELGGKMVDFGGWDLPVQYSGILEEHRAVRERAGVFDVSHMGEITVRGPQAVEFLQKTTCNDVARMDDWRCQYNGVLYPTGGFVDDILIYRHGPEDYLVVVNASNTEKDFEWLTQNAAEFDVDVRNVSNEYAQLAIQGPRSEEVVQKLTDADLSKVRYYRFVRANVLGIDAIVSRTGYTGEDGFEIYCTPDAVERVMRQVLDAGREHEVLPCGLGARDTLRLEAKMALYGNDIDHSTTPLEADLGWIVQLGKGDFLGRDILEREQNEGVRRKLAGFEMLDRGIGRHGYPVVDGQTEIGVVTSGSHSPTLKKAIGLAYLPPEKTTPGSEFLILIRGKETRARVVPTPFYKRSK